MAGVVGRRTGWLGKVRRVSAGHGRQGLAWRVVDRLGAAGGASTTSQPATMLSSATWRSSCGLRGRSIGRVSRRVLSSGQVCPVLEQKDSGERAPEDDSDQLRASSGFCRW
jgi:hypothetical protein